MCMLIMVVVVTDKVNKFLENGYQHEVFKTH